MSTEQCGHVMPDYEDEKRDGPMVCTYFKGHGPVQPDPINDPEVFCDHGNAERGAHWSLTGGASPADEIRRTRRAHENDLMHPEVGYLIRRVAERDSRDDAEVAREFHAAKRAGQITMRQVDGMAFYGLAEDPPPWGSGDAALTRGDGLADRSDRSQPDPDRAEVDRVATLLMDAWAVAEGTPVTPSYVATFVDMARAVIADFASPLAEQGGGS